MDAQRFDAFARTLGQSNNRRAFLRVLGIGVASALLGTFGLDQASAQTPPFGGPGRSCSTSADCPPGMLCDPTTLTCTNPNGPNRRGRSINCTAATDCPPGMTCDTTTQTCSPAGGNNPLNRPSCTAPSDCPTGMTCNPATQLCVQCVTASDCPTGMTCDPTTSTCTGSASGTTCTPTTCAAQLVLCGTIPDGCGGTLNCGTCPCPCGTPGCEPCPPCSATTDCATTQIGHVCLSGACGCNTDTDCPAGLTCNPVLHTCGGGTLVTSSSCPSGQKLCPPMLTGPVPHPNSYCIPSSGCCTTNDCPNNLVCADNQCVCGGATSATPNPCGSTCCSLLGTCCGGTLCCEPNVLGQQGCQYNAAAHAWTCVPLQSNCPPGTKPCALGCCIESCPSGQYVCGDVCCVGCAAPNRVCGNYCIGPLDCCTFGQPGCIDPQPYCVSAGDVGTCLQELPAG